VERREAPKVGVGIDFGTSNSTVAWFDGEQIRYVAFEGSGEIFPTAIHLNRSFAATVGAPAINRYVEENRGRLVQLRAEVIGEAAASIGGPGTKMGDDGAPEMNRHVIYGAMFDPGQPGRLFHGLKRMLGNKSIQRLMVFERPYRLVALITPILQRLRDGAGRALSEPEQSVHIGRPVNFEGVAGSSNEVALSRLSEASSNAGMAVAHFYPEPIAATLSYLWRAKPAKAGIALTVDFGGGTLDLSVIRYDGREFRVLATDGIGLGGNRIDQLIFQRVLFPLLGQGETWIREVDGRRIETPFPFEQYEEGLLNWAMTHMLNQGATISRVISCIEHGGPATEKFERLLDVIRFNLGFNCILAIRAAKAALSSVEETTIEIPELALSIPFTRAQFNTMLSGMMQDLADVVSRVLKRANLPPEAIDLVIRTGGSSQIVAVQTLLETLFPGKVTEHDPFTSVAGGLAIANYHGYQFA
jgi:hypothetical chaperone protein